MNFLLLNIIAISLSIDAFSLALVFGTNNIKNKDKILLSTIVGTYHFFMPLIGLSLGFFLISKLIINMNLILSLILIAIAVEMFLSIFSKEENKIILNIFGYLLFGLSVSIDSLTVGFGLSSITDNYFLTSTIFFFYSFLLTYIGLNIGNYLQIKCGIFAKIFATITLFIIGIIFLFK